MTKRLHSDSRIQAIYDAIVAKTGDDTPMTTHDMALAIANIKSGSDLLALASGTDIFDLDDATVPTEATGIPQYMFYGNQKVRDVALTTIEDIGAYAFNGCSNISNIDLPSCTTIEEKAFYQCRRASAAAASNTFNLPNCVSIGENAFNEFCINNNNMVLSLPECINIANGGFRSTSASYGITIKELYLPKIQSIGNYAFQRSVITDVKIGSHVPITFGTSVFMSAQITNLYCYATTPPSVGTNIVGDGTISHIYVPAESLSAYQSASGWNLYQNVIAPMPS